MLRISEQMYPNVNAQMAMEISLLTRQRNLHAGVVLARQTCHDLSPSVEAQGVSRTILQLTLQVISDSFNVLTSWPISLSPTMGWSLVVLFLCYSLLVLAVRGEHFTK